MQKLRYQVCARHPETHQFEVKCFIPVPNRAGQIFSLPAWIPGSYLIRDFSRHVIDLKASVRGRPVKIRMLNKDTWQCENLENEDILDPLILSYKVYAYDLTPRGAHVDTTHAFFNGSRIFMQVKGYEDKPCEVELLKPEDPKYHSWRVATSMLRSLPAHKSNMIDHQSKTSDHPSNYEFGIYQAENYDDLIDHPVEMGNFSVTTFHAKDVLHELVITHTINKDIEHLDIPRLNQDLQKIAEHHIDFFGEVAAKERYLFLLTIFKGGQGGIEHKFASIAHTSYEEMPKLKFKAAHYRNLLSLLSHEYFHTWHVKRIKPLAFTPYDLTQENYTRLLWLFEGFTSYYDDLSLVRTGLINVQSYLDALTELMNGVYATPGRMKQTLEASSFEAWIKLYKPDENSRNSSISYYAKGALVGLCLDLLLRSKSQGKISLDDIMRALWIQYGRTEQGISEDGFEVLAQKICGFDLSDFFDKTLRSTEELPLAELLGTVGIEMTWHPVKPLENLGGRISNNGREGTAREGVELLEVLSDSALEKAGLAAKDQIIAINHHKVDRLSIDKILTEYSEGEQLEIHSFRRDELKVSFATVEMGNSKTVLLQLNPTATPLQKNGLQSWLNQWKQN